MNALIFNVSDTACAAPAALPSDWEWLGFYLYRVPSFNAKRRAQGIKYVVDFYLNHCDCPARTYNPTKLCPHLLAGHLLLSAMGQDVPDVAAFTAPATAPTPAPRVEPAAPIACDGCGATGRLLLRDGEWWLCASCRLDGTVPRRPSVRQVEGGMR